jgi:hypothetical protein
VVLRRLLTNLAYSSSDIGPGRFRSRASATSAETTKASSGKGSGAETIPELDEAGADEGFTCGILIDPLDAEKDPEILPVPEEPSRTTSDRLHLHLDEVFRGRDALESAASKRPLPRG